MLIVENLKKESDDNPKEIPQEYSKMKFSANNGWFQKLKIRSIGIQTLVSSRIADDFHHLEVRVKIIEICFLIKYKIRLSWFRWRVNWAPLERKIRVFFPLLSDYSSGVMILGLIWEFDWTLLTAAFSFPADTVGDDWSLGGALSERFFSFSFLHLLSSLSFFRDERLD